MFQLTHTKYIALVIGVSSILFAADRSDMVGNLPSAGDNPSSEMVEQYTKESPKASKVKPYIEGEAIVVYREALSADGEHKIGENSLTDGTDTHVSVYQALSQSSKKTIALVKSSKTTDALIRQLKKDPRVKSAFPNYIYKTESTTNDPDIDRQWGLPKVKAFEAWDTESNASDVVVAVIDTGVEYDHKDLAENIWVNAAEKNGQPGVDDDNNGYVDDIHGYDFAPGGTASSDADPSPSGYHGTHCAGIIGAVGDNGIGGSGVAPHVKIMAVKASSNGHSLSTSALLNAMEYIIANKQHGVNIVSVNASYGGSYFDNAMYDAIKILGDNGIILCAAAGNRGSDNDQRHHYPSDYNLTNIVSVAATADTDKLAYFSCYGAQSVDIAAPGQRIYSTVSRGAVLTGSNSLWMDDVENNDSNWAPTSTWAITDTKAYNSTHSWTDSPNGNSPAGVSYLTYSKDIDLTAHKGDHIGVGAQISYSLGMYTSFAVEMSADGGQTWSAFEPFISTRNASDRSDWASFAVEIPTQFKTSHFRMRFKFNPVYHDHDGIYLDNIAIGPVIRPNRYSYLSGTSMATPFVTGSLALIATVFPDENVTQRIDRLLSAVTPLKSLKGKILTGGQLNVEKALRQDLVIKHARLRLEKNYGIVPGDTLEINGTRFGEVQGTVVFEEDGNSSQEVTPVAWSRNHATAVVPSMAGKYLSLKTSEGIPSLNSLPITAWNHSDDANGTYRVFRYGTVASHDNKVYYFGGRHYYRYYDENNTRHSTYDKNATWVYTPDSDQWNRVADVPIEPILPGTTVLEDKAYLIGGLRSYDGNNSHEYVYDFTNDTWSNIAPLPEAARGWFGHAVALNGKIYYFGGASLDNGGFDNPNKKMYVYSPMQNQWEDLNASLPYGLFAGYAFAHDNKVYLAGGMDGNDTVHDSVFVYDPADNNWTESPTHMPLPLARGGIASNGTEVLIVGGDTNKIDDNNYSRRVVVNKMLMYYPSSDTWADLSGGIFAPLKPSVLAPMAYANGSYIKPDYGLHGRRMEILRDSKQWTNRVPTAKDMNITTQEDHNVTFVLGGNDADGDTLKHTITVRPSHGTLVGDAPHLTYVPDANYNGTDTLSYTVNDGMVDSPEANVSVGIVAVNDAPIAESQKLETAHDTNISITLSGKDVDGDTLTYTITTAPSHGTLSGAGPQRVYTPNTDYNGTDTFGYKVNDGTVDSAEANVSLEIKGSDGGHGDNNATDGNTTNGGNGDNNTTDGNTTNGGHGDNNTTDGNTTNGGHGDNNTTGSGGSGGGCTYNPNAKGFDVTMLLMVFFSLLYPFRRNFFSIED